jgi:hypothetical protein
MLPRSRMYRPVVVAGPVAQFPDAIDPALLLRCANPGCFYLQHGSGSMGGYCCKRCHVRRFKPKSKVLHGKLCEKRIPADQGLERALSEDPDSPMIEPAQTKLPRLIGPRSKQWHGDDGQEEAGQEEAGWDEEEEESPLYSGTDSCGASGLGELFRKLPRRTALSSQDQAEQEDDEWHSDDEVEVQIEPEV